MTASVIFSFVKFLLHSFREDDIETLIFLFHNIGLQLRKTDPDSLIQIIDLFTQKKNSYLAELKLNKEVNSNKERKLGFLNLELQDIKNNKGSVTI